MKAAYLSSTAMVLCFLVGCSRTTDSPAPVQKPKAAEPAPSGIAMAVTINKLVNDEGEETTESLKTYEDPSAAQVEEKLNAINWADPKLRPTVGLARRDKGKLESGLKITRPRDSKATAAVHAEWIQYQKNQMLTAPLDGLETASKLLRAFLENRELDDLAKWSKAEE